MKTCIYCDSDLVLPPKNAYFQLSRCYGGEIDHHLETMNDKYVLIFCHNNVDMYFSNFAKMHGCILLQDKDINLIKNKSIEEIEELYNKMRIFE